MKLSEIKNLSDMLQTEEWDIFRSEVKGFQSLCINDSERANRVWEAAENGADGSTHGEALEDMREFLNDISITDDYHEGDISEETRDLIKNEINECEAYHEKSGSLDKQIG